MPRVAQFGIALGTLGAMLTLMGLFPGITGLEPTLGIGLVQVFVIVLGLSVLLVGGLFYVKFAFYAFEPNTLAQQIAVRLALSGIVFMVLTGLADVFGFGSNPRIPGSDIVIGPLQTIGLIGSFAIGSIGVILYALFGGDATP